MKKISVLFVVLVVGLAATALWSCNSENTTDIPDSVVKSEIEKPVPEVAGMSEAVSIAANFSERTRDETDCLIGMFAVAEYEYSGKYWGLK